MTRNFGETLKLRQEGSVVRVPDNIIECVCFLCIKKVDNDREYYTVGGTAFFVSIPSETHPDIGYVYLVTARHCADAAFALCLFRRFDFS